MGTSLRVWRSRYVVDFIIKVYTSLSIDTGNKPRYARAYCNMADVLFLNPLNLFFLSFSGTVGVVGVAGVTGVTGVTGIADFCCIETSVGASAFVSTGAGTGEGTGPELTCPFPFNFSGASASFGI